MEFFIFKFIMFQFTQCSKLPRMRVRVDEFFQLRVDPHQVSVFCFVIPMAHLDTMKLIDST